MLTYTHTLPYLYLNGFFLLTVYENEDQLLWRPEVISENKVKEYLFETSLRTGNEKTIGRIPEGIHTRDNEQVCLIAYLFVTYCL